MRILHVVPAQLPVQAYGGTERSACTLMKTLAEFGHEIWVLCRPGSRLPYARVVEWPAGTPPPPLPAGIEIVHYHCLPFAEWAEAPYLCTIHGNGKAGERFPPNTVFVSEDHARRHGWTEFVHNSVDPDEYPLERRRDPGRFVFLAKASWWVKNLRGSIRIAKDAGGTLDVMGGARPFWCLSRSARFRGMVGGETKIRLLQSAQALLFPVIWNEPFGIAIVEALACGTPVVGTPRGALPEIITPECGVLADTHEALVAGARAALKLDPEACRARVVTHFSNTRSAQKCLDYYRRVLAQGKLREGTPQKPDGVPAEERLPYLGLSRFPLVF